jgi:hypothetical protein
MTARSVDCPPDAPDGAWFCAWEFTLDGAQP